MGKFAGRYSRLARADIGGEATDVIEVTGEYTENDLDADWTEVVLFGNKMEQDTVSDPHDGDPFMPAYWVPEYLYRRFFDSPGNVDVELDPCLHWRNESRVFETLAGRRKHAFSRCESVEGAGGVVVHFMYDPAHADRPWENASSEGALQTSESFAAIVYRNEIYDLRHGSQWISAAPKFGISFAARHINVLVELDENYEVKPEMYGQFLQYNNGNQERVELESFSDLIRRSRPHWLLEMFEGLAKTSEPSRDLINDLTAFCMELGVQLYKDIDRSAPPVTEQSVRPDRKETELHIVQLYDPQDIKDRWLDGRAACYYPDTKQFFVNANYESIQALYEHLLADAQKEGGSRSVHHDLETIARKVALEQIVRRLSRSLVYALAKQEDGARWHPGHIQKAASPEAFSIVADEWRDILPMAKAILHERLGLFVEDEYEAQRQTFRRPVFVHEVEMAAPSSRSGDWIPSAPHPGQTAAGILPPSPSLKHGFRVRKLSAGESKG
jgi:hypothetical protein